MSYIGNNPKWNTQTNTPRSADPANPVEGMVFYADGTSRAEGLWVYVNGVWQQVGNTISDLSVYAQFDAEDLDVSNFTNVSITSTSPFNGDNSYEISSYPADFGTITLPDRSKNRTNALVCQASVSSGSSKLVIRDNSSTILAEVILDSATLTSITLPYHVIGTATSITLDIEDESSAGTTKIDDIIFTDDPVRSARSEVRQAYQISQNGVDLLLLNAIRYNLATASIQDAGETLIEASDSGSRTEWIAKRDSYVTVNLHTQNSSVGGTQGIFKVSDSSEIGRGSEASAANDATMTSVSFFLPAGEGFFAGAVAGAPTSSASNPVQLSFVASASSEAIISSTDSVQPARYTGQPNSTIASGVVTYLDYDTVDKDDDAIAINVGSGLTTVQANAMGFEIKETGWYKITAAWASDGGQLDLDERITLSVVGGGSTLFQSVLEGVITIGNATLKQIVASDIAYLTQGDIVNAQIFQTTAQTLASDGGDSRNFFSIHKVDKKALALVDVQTIYQANFLSTPFNANDSDNADLRFSNLTPGKHYKVKIAMQTTTTGNNPAVIQVTHDGTELCRVSHRSAGSTGIQNSESSRIFQATTDTVVFNLFAAVDATIGGNGTASDTFAELEELPNHKLTTKFS